MGDINRISHCKQFYLIEFFYRLRLKNCGIPIPPSLKSKKKNEKEAGTIQKLYNVSEGSEGQWFSYDDQLNNRQTVQIPLQGRWGSTI